MRYGDIAVTEAGFGFDLGGEKFLDIKCAYGDMWPSVVVLVATVRALKMHGGAPKDALGVEDLAALSRGMLNLERHLDNVRIFGLPGRRGDQPVPDGLAGRDRVSREALRRAGRQGRPVRGLHPRRRRGRGSRPAVLDEIGQRPRALPAALSLGPAARREDRDHRAPPLRRRRRLVFEGGRAAARNATRSRVSAISRSTSPRPRTRFRTIRRRAGAPRDSRCTWTRRASSRARGSSSRSAATS